ncbi:MAG TPA: hypothetical protein VES95_02500 [Dermatophilaceae bacterium]|nr:hypothetical protein [Dermatophilaceae bacterium]
MTSLPGDLAPVTVLLERWAGAVRALAPAAPVGEVEAAGRGLLSRWDERHRRYHGRRHLTEVLDAVDALAAETALPEREAALARLAAWLHDAVYEAPAAAARGETPPPEADERASAALGSAVLAGLGVPPGEVARVAALVAATAGHDPVAPDRTTAVVVDADLWVLGAAPERFDGYCREVREEYAHVDEPAYRQGRRAVLEPLLARPSLYLTAAARERWEPDARTNLRRELSRLAGPAPARPAATRTGARTVPRTPPA